VVSNDCWPWLGARKPATVPVFTIVGKGMRAVASAPVRDCSEKQWYRIPYRVGNALEARFRASCALRRQDDDRSVLSIVAGIACRCNSRVLCTWQDAQISCVKQIFKAATCRCSARRAVARVAVRWGSRNHAVAAPLKIRYRYRSSARVRFAD